MGEAAPAAAATTMKGSRSTAAWLATAAVLVAAWRREGARQTGALDALKPRGEAAASGSRVGAAPMGADLIGRDADAPQDIPARGWWQALKRTAQKFSENELMSEAASVTFYALLSLFPAVTAIVSIYGLFADRSTIEGQLDNAAALIPSGGMEIIRDQVHRLTQAPASGLGIGAVIGLLTALWSANAGTKALLSAMNDVYGEREGRGFVKVTLTSLAFTVGGIVMVLLGLGLIVVVPLALEWFGLGGIVDTVVKVARWPAAMLVLIPALALIYRFGPSRNLARWRWVSWGGAIAALGWIGLSVGFSWYVAHFGNYNKTYGSLGAMIGFMTWIWLSTTVVLLGAQLNAELETQTARDSTVGAEKPIGSRGASAANVVA